MTMNQNPPASLTPHEAAAALSRLEHYEETLTARAFGITVIAFGIAGAATSLTYAYAADWFAAAGLAFLLSFLWLPWIFAAGLLTSLTWQTQSITLRRTEDNAHGSWLYWIFFSLLYMAILGAVWLLDTRLGLDLGEPVQNLLTLGVFTAALAAVFQFRHGYGWMLRTLYIVAAILIVAALAFSTLALASVPAALLSAGTGGLVWVTAGTYIALRG